MLIILAPDWAENVVVVVVLNKSNFRKKQLVVFVVSSSHWLSSPCFNYCTCCAVFFLEQHVMRARIPWMIYLVISLILSFFFFLTGTNIQESLSYISYYFKNYRFLKSPALPCGVLCHCFIKTQNSLMQAPDARHRKEISVYLQWYGSSNSWQCIEKWIVRG